MVDKVQYQRIINFLSPKNIINISASNRKELFQIAVEHAFPDLNQDQKVSIIHDLIEREQIGSTYVDKNLAMPRVRVGHIKKSFAVLVKLNKCIKYTKNEEVCYAIFLFVQDCDCNNIQQCMDILYNKVTSTEFINGIKYAPNNEHIWNLSCNIDWNQEKANSVKDV